MLDADFDAWKERARSVRIEAELKRRGIYLRGGVERCGPCPKCGGTDRFSINIAKQTWHCRGCKTKAVKGDVIGFVEWIDGVDFVRAVETLTGAPPPKPSGKGRHADKTRKVVAGRFDYVDQAGNLLFQVERVEFQHAAGNFVVTENGKHKKTFHQRRPDPTHRDKWIWNVDGVPIVPYRLPELLEAVGNEQTVFIVEGEQKARLLAQWGVPSTCCAGGAEKWKREHSEFLRGADVVILPDNDDRGRSHAQAVAQSLKDVASRIRVVELPDLLEKGDILDWQAKGHSREELDALVDAAADWQSRDGGDDAAQMDAAPTAEDSIALCFAARYADELRYVAVWGWWLSYDGTRWARDETLHAFDLARAICREIASNANKPSSAVRSAKAVAAVERLAKADRRLAATTAQWDVDGWLLNTGEDHDDERNL